MAEFDKKLEAQQREMPEPSEGSRPIPWLVIIIVAAVFSWAIGYIWSVQRLNDPGLGDLRSVADFAPSKSGSAGVADGAQVYAAQCVACHQANGAGLPGVFPPLAGSEWVVGKPSTAIQIVLHGISGELTVKGAVYKGQMPTFKDKLNDTEIAAVLSHVRASFGNQAEKIGADEVKAQRAATQSHGQPWNGDAELSRLR